MRLAAEGRDVGGADGWRTLALLLFLVGVVGVAAELFLLGHYEDPPQWTPLALLAVGLFTGVAAIARPSEAVVRLLRGVGGAFVLAAALGIYFHVRSNVEFELELRPTIEGRELLWESLSGAMPALAPGAMAQLGLLALLATFKHPLLHRGLRPSDTPSGKD